MELVSNCITEVTEPARLQIAWNVIRNTILQSFALRFEQIALLELCVGFIAYIMIDTDNNKLSFT